MQNGPTEPLSAVTNLGETEENAASQPMDENSIDPKLLAMFPPGAVFPIWSPYDSYDAAAMLLEALAEHEKKQQSETL